jgi:hypothetical protein
MPAAHAAPAAGLATLASVAPPSPPAAEAKPAADAPKKPLVDPKLALLLPLGVFGAFAVLTLFVVLYALVIRPRTGAAAHGAATPAAVTPP